MGTGSAAAPRAEKRSVTTVHHGRQRTDDYGWLRAENWQEVMRDPSVLASDIRSYLDAENLHTETTLADTAALQSDLFEEMKGRIKQDDSSPPSPDGEYAYYVDYVVGGQHPRYCREARDGGAKRIIVDGDALAEGKSYFRLAGVTHSPDHTLVAYCSDDRGSEFFTACIVDAETGEPLDDLIENTSGNVEWSQDGSHIFYSLLDENHRPSKIYRHKLGSSQADDICIYEESDAGFFVGVGKTQSGAYLIISAHDHQTSEVHLIDAAKPTSPLRCVAEREAGHEYDVEHVDDRLIILTNHDGAEDFKIVSAPLATPSADNWTELVRHEPGRLILSLSVYANHMVRLERKNGLPRIIVTELRSGVEHAIEFDEEAYSLGLSAGLEFDTTTVRFTYSSMTTPAQVFDYDMGSRSRVLRKSQEIPSGHEPGQYITRRVFALADDGESVPVSLLYRKNTPLDGSAPLLLYGYGAYGISIPASFSTNCLSLVDRGFIYAIAHVRGGKDKGYRWYRLGRREHKINSFTDFVAAANHLVEMGLTRPGAIVAQGGSAGGMLMGAITNIAPQLFGGVIAEVPFVDVLATMLDDTLPLTPPEWPEWGNPIESVTDYDAMAAYSPYDNVQRKSYPPILAIAGLTDPRVTYWEPAKWVAKLREFKTDDNLLLLKTNMDAGHGGAAGRFDRLHEIALIYAFALKVSGRDG
jgi:oligopeptidase B